MNNGVVFTAYDNERILYTKQAIYNALRIKREWGDIPISIITDEPDKFKEYTSIFDQIIENEKPEITRLNVRKYNDSINGSMNLSYFNGNRSSVYELSPYDETLLLDTDYIIQSPVLKGVFGCQSLMQMNKKAVNLGWKQLDHDLRLDDFGIPMYWMTAFYFKKDPVCESVFQLIDFVKENWGYYKSLFGFRHSLYRNDYAISIAVHLLNDMNEDYGIDPLPQDYILTALDMDDLIHADNKKFVFLTRSGDGVNWDARKIDGIDVHILNKFSLQRYLDDLIKEIR